MSSYFSKIDYSSKIQYLSNVTDMPIEVEVKVVVLFQPITSVKAQSVFDSVANQAVAKLRDLLKEKYTDIVESNENPIYP